MNSHVPVAYIKKRILEAGYEIRIEMDMNADGNIFLRVRVSKNDDMVYTRNGVATEKYLVRNQGEDTVGLMEDDMLTGIYNALKERGKVRE